LSLVRSFGEAGDFVVLRVFKRLALLLFRLGGSVAADRRSFRRQRNAGGCGHGANPEG
jgi:hypothetical protein